MGRNKKNLFSLQSAPKSLTRARFGCNDLKVSRGMGPNKACGHKGGISRQGSKRG